MAQCTLVKFKHRRICIGDLNRVVSLMTRTLDAPQSSVDFGHTFTDLTTWAALATVKGKDVFAGTNMSTLISHIFYVRYRSDVTAEWWIKYKSKNYDIVDTENLEERNEFLAIFCNVRGASDQPVNES